MRLLSVDAATTGRDRVALASLISGAQADVACVHNSPHLLRWRSTSAALGRRSGLVVAGGGRPAGANLLLCSLGVDAPASRDLSFDVGGVMRPAGAVLGHLRVRGTDVVLVAAALVGNAAQRLDQVVVLQRAIERFLPGDVPSIVSVHGAVRPGTAAWQALAEGRVAAAGRVFVDERLAVGASSKLDGHASAANPPVVVDIIL